jgi:hypothetical protein
MAAIAEPAFANITVKSYSFCFMSVEKQVSSMVVAFDGPSKCGKTTFAEMVAEEARFQKSFLEGRELDDEWINAEQIRASVADWAESVNFRHISTISAGNVFRAAAYYAITEAEKGNTITSFVESDVDRLRELLAQDGIIDTLQNDPEIGKRVSPIAKFSGAQALCGTIFCDSIVEAYERDGGSNLVIVDARDPLGHLERNKILGKGIRRIPPDTVIPLYIDTPIQVAASRMSGELQDNIALIEARRRDDETRAELPVMPPEVLTEDTSGWLLDLLRNTDTYIPTHLLARNTEEVTLENVQFLASIVASAAHERGLAITRAAN